MKKVVALCSGGIDSTVMLHSFKQDGYDVTALIVEYGQRHKKETSYAANMCDDLGVLRRHCYLEMPVSKVPLLGEGEIPDGYYTDESMKQTIVPSRNAIFISIAFGLAVSISADEVATAVHSGDHPIYPDCRPEFISSLEVALRLGTESRTRLSAPFAQKTKSDIVVIGNKLGVDFSKTWSCYKGRELHCGKCGTCTERKEAFQLAKVRDPTIYEMEET